MFHIFLSPPRSRILYVLPPPSPCFSSTGRYSISVSSSLSLPPPPRPPFFSCSIRMHLANIHHWTSLLCLRLDGIHPNICMPSNLREEWNNPAKTNQSFIKLHPQPILRPPRASCRRPRQGKNKKKCMGATLPAAGQANGRCLSS